MVKCPGMQQACILIMTRSITKTGIPDFMPLLHTMDVRGPLTVIQIISFGLIMKHLQNLQNLKPPIQDFIAGKRFLKDHSLSAILNTVAQIGWKSGMPRYY